MGCGLFNRRGGHSNPRDLLFRWLGFGSAQHLMCNPKDLGPSNGRVKEPV